MKGWVGLIGWPIAEVLSHKWSSSATGRAQDRETSPAKIPTFYHCATQPTSGNMPDCSVRWPVFEYHNRQLCLLLLLLVVIGLLRWPRLVVSVTWRSDIRLSVCPSVCLSVCPVFLSNVIISRGAHSAWLTRGNTKRGQRDLSHAIKNEGK